MASDKYIYGPDIQRAIDTNGGMHFVFVVGGFPCGVLCEQYGGPGVSNASFASTPMVERVTCPNCLGMMNK